MITFSKLGKKGNIGNQLFQIASTIGISIKNNSEFGFTKWDYSHYFKNELPTFEINNYNNVIRFEEISYKYNELTFNKKESYDLEGWFQSEKYFIRDETKKYFEFKDSYIKDIKNKYNNHFKRKTILISIRRGDFVNHPDYFQLPINYYINSLVKYFPDWENSYNLFVFSDDINYAKYHFGDFCNVIFNEDISVIEQLIISSFCDNFIISNSTFSWWCAWLGEKDNSIIIRPKSNFSDLKKMTDDDSDYFPERWIKYNHEFQKLKIEVANFKIIPYKKLIHDYYERNFEVVIKDDYKTKLIIYSSFIPPLILFSLIKKNENIIAYNKNYSFISCFFERRFLIEQLDFGVFSNIFYFNNETIVEKTVEIQYNYFQDYKQEKINMIGKLNIFLGNSFIIKRYIKKIITTLKTNVKRIYLSFTNK